MTRREFSPRTKLDAWGRSGGRCECGCGQLIHVGEGPEYHHRIPCALGGEPSLANCAVLRRGCHLTITTGEDMPRIVKARRLAKKQANITGRKAIMPGSRLSAFKRRLDGTVERR
jgi:hypothetical protein